MDGVSGNRQTHLTHLKHHLWRAPLWITARVRRGAPEEAFSAKAGSGFVNENAKTQ
jgi:hypothetical protein